MKEATDGTMRLRGPETLSYSVGSMWKGLLEGGSSGVWKLSLFKELRSERKEGNKGKKEDEVVCQ